jgi:hypothetical protein
MERGLVSKKNALMHVCIFIMLVCIASRCPQSRCISNDDCGPEAYCKKQPGDCEGTGTCQQRPDACAEIYAPVCGCDQTTYGNTCEAEAAGVNVLGAEDCSAVLCDVSECGPAPGSANSQCPDGTIGGPTGRCLHSDNETCSWEIRLCPDSAPQRALLRP